MESSFITHSLATLKSLFPDGIYQVGTPTQGLENDPLSSFVGKNQEDRTHIYISGDTSIRDKELELLSKSLSALSKQLSDFHIQFFDQLTEHVAIESAIAAGCRKVVIFGTIAEPNQVVLNKVTESKSIKLLSCQLLQSIANDKPAKLAWWQSFKEFIG